MSNKICEKCLKTLENQEYKEIEMLSSGYLKIYRMRFCNECIKNDDNIKSLIQKCEKFWELSNEINDIVDQNFSY
jgi:hypothetical protein